jgi:hypothetical protein
MYWLLPNSKLVGHLTLLVGFAHGQRFHSFECCSREEVGAAAGVTAWYCSWMDFLFLFV